MKKRATHGTLFRKLRKDRGLLLKEVAGEIISVQTLRRFETDETSVSLAVFEKLLQAMGITYNDFLLAYQLEEPGRQRLAVPVENFMKERNFSAVLSFCKDYLSRENLTLGERIEVAIYARSAMSTVGGAYAPILKENEKQVFQYLQKVEQYTIRDYALLAVLFEVDEEQIEFPMSFLRKVIEQILSETASVAYDIYAIKELHRRKLLRAALELMGRKGYLEKAEIYCQEAIDKYQEVTYDMGLDGELLYLHSLLASLQLQQGKAQGVIEANKVMQMIDARIILYHHEMDKQLRQKNYERFYRLNQTEEDFLF